MTKDAIEYSKMVREVLTEAVADKDFNCAGLFVSLQTGFLITHLLETGYSKSDAFDFICNKIKLPREDVSKLLQDFVQTKTCKTMQSWALPEQACQDCESFPDVKCTSCGKNMTEEEFKRMKEFIKS